MTKNHFGKEPACGIHSSCPTEFGGTFSTSALYTHIPSTRWRSSVAHQSGIRPPKSLLCNNNITKTPGEHILGSTRTQHGNGIDWIKAAYETQIAKYDLRPTHFFLTTKLFTYIIPMTILYQSSDKASFALLFGFLASMFSIGRAIFEEIRFFCFFTNLETLA